MLVIRVVVVLRARRLVASLLSVKSLVLIGFFIFPPAGAHGGFNVAEQVETTKCAFASGATAAAGLGRRASAGCYRRASFRQPSVASGSAALRIRRRCRRVKGTLGLGDYSRAGDVGDDRRTRLNATRRE